MSIFISNLAGVTQTPQREDKSSGTPFEVKAEWRMKPLKNYKWRESTRRILGLFAYFLRTCNAKDLAALTAAQ